MKLPRALDAASALSIGGALALVGLAFPAGCAAPPAPVVAPAPTETSEAPPPPAPMPEAPKAHRFAVAAENETAARVALSTLEHGGNAVDAAIAGILTSGVVHPVSSGLGGGGFALVWDPKTRAVTMLDFRETAPRALKPNDLDHRTGLSDKKRGSLFGVPGEVAGLAELHARFGKLAFGDDVRPAAEVASAGFPVSGHLARTLKWNEPWVLRSPLASVFGAAGKLLPARETAKNPALAETLRRVAAEGKKAFYEGVIADDVVETAKAGGSRITRRDLNDYQVVERSPLRTTWEGYEVVTAPPESGGGLMVMETLSMHRKADLVAQGYGSGGYLHLMAETFRGAIADRVRHVGDPGFRKLDAMALASEARMKARRAQISLTRTTRAEKFGLHESGTTHLVVVDEEGRVVSITSTINDMFGSKLVARGGFVLNDELDDFSTASLERQFGIIPGRGPNSARGGARPASSMTPTLVLQGGAPVFALGGSGGLRIATATTQVLLARLAFDRSVADAVADPRIDPPPAGGLSVDPSLDPAQLEDLERRGEIVDTTRVNLSAVQAIGIGTRDGVRFLEPAADPRKGGAALVE